MLNAKIGIKYFLPTKNESLWQMFCFWGSKPNRIVWVFSSKFQIFQIFMESNFRLSIFAIVEISRFGIHGDTRRVPNV